MYVHITINLNHLKTVTDKLDIITFHPHYNYFV